MIIEISTSNSNTMKMSVSPYLSFAGLFFLVFFSMLKVCWCTTLISCPEIEKQSLLSIKRSLHDPANNLSSWKAEVSCCEWSFVSCSKLTGNVHELNLGGISLRGEISNSISNLTSLRILDLSGNELYGDILNSISNLTFLRTLDLSSNEFYGEISNSISNLTSLRILDLSGNELYGDILNSISNLTFLRTLDLSGNELYGDILNSISNLTFLRTLDLSSNEFYGEISNSISNLTSLYILDLSYNRFYCEISNSMSNLTSLRALSLSNNKFYGNIPRGINNLCELQYLYLSGNNLQGDISDLFGNISSCSLRALESLDLSENGLSGNIPRGINNLCKLQYLDLGENNLEGDVSDLFGNISSCSLRALEELDLTDNLLSGNLPETVGQLSNLVSLCISNNKFEGVVTETHFVRLSKLMILDASKNNMTLKVDPNWIPPFKIEQLGLGSWNLGSRIPSWLDTQKMSIYYLELSNAGLNDKVPSWIFSITTLDLSHNQLHGMIPVIPTPSYSGIDTQLVDLGSNRFSGQLPPLSPRSSKSLPLSLYLSNNLLSGDLSDFLCNNTSASHMVQVLSLGGNHISGALPNCFINWSSLYMLNLSNNNLFGRIPNSIGLLADLDSLNLNGNNFSGDIPLSMGNCTSLSKIDLADNNLSGNRIPTSLSHLSILILKSNRLSGEITSAICMLSSLKILDLSNNMFSGTIPRCVNNFTAMTITRGGYDEYGFAEFFQESASISTKGREFTYNYRILPSVRSFDISRNNLSGNIPDEITSLVLLRSLNLSGNQLEGRIPFAIGNMTQLESLDISNNSLSGELPNSLKAMSYLNYLNVSYNQLAGRIPESTQLCSFDRSSFVGNLHLWGPPLTTSCANSGGKASHGTTHANDEEVDKPKIEWVYVFISLGCAVGLSASLTTLFVKRSWREAYFELIEDMWDTAYVYFHIKWRKLKTAALGVNM